MLRGELDGIQIEEQAVSASVLIEAVAVFAPGYHEIIGGIMIAVLKRKIQTFKRDPACLNDKLRSGIRRARSYLDHVRTVDGSRKLSSEVYKELLRTAGVYDVIRQFISARPNDSIPPDYGDLWFLYSVVRKRRPKVLFEFGSGVSTAVLAKAAQDNKKGLLYSIEALEPWFQSTRNCMPESLKGSYEIIHRPATEVTYRCKRCAAAIRAFRHERLPAVVPDFIYLDGPPLSSDVKVAIDVLEMEPKLKPGFCLIIDGRQDNMRFFRRHLARRYAFRWRPNHQNSFFLLKK